MIDLGSAWKSWTWLLKLTVELVYPPSQMGMGSLLTILYLFYISVSISNSAKYNFKKWSILLAKVFFQKEVKQLKLIVICCSLAVNCKTLEHWNPDYLNNLTNSPLCVQKILLTVMSDEQDTTIFAGAGLIGLIFFNNFTLSWADCSKVTNRFLSASQLLELFQMIYEINEDIKKFLQGEDIQFICLHNKHQELNSSFNFNFVGHFHWHSVSSDKKCLRMQCVLQQVIY